jgi:hypothetical protein
VNGTGSERAISAPNCAQRSDALLCQGSRHDISAAAVSTPAVAEHPPRAILDFATVAIGAVLSAYRTAVLMRSNSALLSACEPAGLCYSQS